MALKDEAAKLLYELIIDAATELKSTKGEVAGIARLAEAYASVAGMDNGGDGRPASRAPRRIL